MSGGLIKSIKLLSADAIAMCCVNRREMTKSIFSFIHPGNKREEKISMVGSPRWQKNKVNIN